MKLVTSHSLSYVTSEIPARRSVVTPAGNTDGKQARRHPPHLHISVRAGLATGQGAALGRRDAALAHLAAKVVPLVPRGALQRAVSPQVGAGVV